MIWLKFNRGCDGGQRWTTWRRLYLRGYIWTPFVVVRRRIYGGAS